MERATGRDAIPPQDTILPHTVSGEKTFRRYNV